MLSSIYVGSLSRGYVFVLICICLCDFFASLHVNHWPRHHRPLRQYDNYHYTDIIHHSSVADRLSCTSVRLSSCKRFRSNINSLKATLLSPYEPDVRSTERRCIYVGSGGIFFWWQAGAAKYVQEHYNITNTRLIGSSAGALTAALLKTNADISKAADVAIDLSHKYNIWDKPSGLAGIWGKIVEEWMEILIPDNLSQEQLNNIYVAATPINIFRRPVMLSHFKDKKSLIQACMTSAHIPFFMNKKLCRKYDGRYYIDGSFRQAVAAILRRQSYPPTKLNGKDIHINMIIDYKLDEEFARTHKDTSIVKLLTPDGVLEMMDAGYKFMHSESLQNHIDLPKKTI